MEMVSLLGPWCCSSKVLVLVLVLFMQASSTSPLQWPPSPGVALVAKVSDAHECTLAYIHSSSLVCHTGMHCVAVDAVSVEPCRCMGMLECMLSVVSSCSCHHVR